MFIQLSSICPVLTKALQKHQLPRSHDESSSVDRSGVPVVTDISTSFIKCMHEAKTNLQGVNISMKQCVCSMCTSAKAAAAAAFSGDLCSSMSAFFRMQSKTGNEAEHYVSGL